MGNLRVKSLFVIAFALYCSNESWLACLAERTHSTPFFIFIISANISGHCNRTFFKLWMRTSLNATTLVCINFIIVAYLNSWKLFLPIVTLHYNSKSDLWLIFILSTFAIKVCSYLVITCFTMINVRTPLLIKGVISTYLLPFQRLYGKDISALFDNLIRTSLGTAMAFNIDLVEKACRIRYLAKFDQLSFQFHDCKLSFLFHDCS